MTPSSSVIYAHGFERSDLDLFFGTMDFNAREMWFKKFRQGLNDDRKKFVTDKIAELKGHSTEAPKELKEFADGSMPKADNPEASGVDLK